MTENDKRIVADMQDTIARIDRAINGKADHELARPCIGDAPMKPVSYWQARRAEQVRWIAEIEASA